MKLPPLPEQASYLFKTLEFNVHGITFAPSYLQAFLMVFLVFLLVLTLGQLRRRLVDWHFKGIVPGIFFGFLITLFLEGFFVIGGKTILTELLGWREAPKPIANVLDAGRGKLVNVLGVTDQIPTSRASEEVTVDQVIKSVSRLSNDDINTLRNTICSP